MKLNEELRSIVGVEYNCNDCENRSICPKNYTCIYFSPINKEEFLDKIIKRLRKNNQPSNQRRLKRYSRIKNNVGLTNNMETLDSYYVQLINDTLSQIRKGKTGYVFTLGQIRDVLKFEPDAEISINDNCYKVSLPLSNKLHKRK